MGKLMLESMEYQGDNLLFAFGNTGKERPETLDFVKRCDDEFGWNSVWLEAKVNPILNQPTTYSIVTYETASRNGEPFEAVIKKYGIPNKPYPHCTRELKLRPIHAYARDYFGTDDFVSAIGIRVDEARRIKISKDKIYPLVEWGITVNAVRRFWDSMPFDLRLKDYEGNCDLCWKKSKRKILTILTENPEAAKWWADMELKYSKLDFTDRRTKAEPEWTLFEKREGTFFGRNNTPIDSFIEMSKFPFEKVSDRFDSDMDAEEPCACMVQEEQLL